MSVGRATPMTPLQKVAMGFVVILLDPAFSGWDALPDFAGWVLALAGVRQLKPALGARYATLFYVGVIALVISVATFVPTVPVALSAALGWFVSLPQLVFMCLLCAALADLALVSQPGDRITAKRFRRLLWAVIVVGALPVLVFGGGIEALAPVAAAVAVGVLVYFVYALFKVSRRDYVLP